MPESNTQMPTPSPKRNYMPRGQMKHLSREAVLEEMGPSRLAFFTLLVILGLLCGALIWSNFVPVVTVSTSIGKVVPSGDQRPVQHLEGGIVKDIYVRDGDFVEAGATLIRFDPNQRGAELGQIRARETALRIREIRLRAQIDDAEPQFGNLAVEYPELVEEARTTLQATRERIAGQHLVAESKISQRQKTVEIHRQQATSFKSQLKLVGEAVEMREKLFDSGHGSRVNVINARLEMARIEASLSESLSTAEQAVVGIEEARNELNELIVTERDKAYEALSGVLSELAEVRQNLRRLEDRVARLDVVSPISGIILGMSVNTPGAVVEPAQALLNIVPVNEQLLAETEIAPGDIGHISVGMLTNVTVNGFDRRRYGIVTGKLVLISPTTILDEEGKPFFKARIKLDTQVIRDGEEVFPIVPGMTVSADIVTGEQTLLQYLTGPVYNALSTSFSER